MAGGDLEIVGVPAFADNYLWLVHDPASGETVAIDPGDPAPVIAEAARRGWTIDAVWNTHWHPDHSGGNAALKAHGATLVAPAEEGRIADIDRVVGEGDQVRIGAHAADVWAVPGHTRGHVAYIFADAGIAFVGDTLFAMGCGRMFEGTPGDMHASLQRLAALPGDTRVYCAHEYTLSNARFAAHADPGNRAIAARLAAVAAARADGLPTVPTTIAEERATNVFLRAADADDFARLRAAKNRF